jgi:hypothetical protein
LFIRVGYPAIGNIASQKRPDNATKNLLDAGCDPRTVLAITARRTEELLAVDAREADQRRRAANAIKKRLFGSAVSP